MAAKAILALCASALLLQIISGQCIGNAFNAGVADNGLTGWVGNGYGAGYGCAGKGYGAGYGWAGKGYGAGYGLDGNCYGVAAPVATGNGGALVVTSSSLIPPTGIYVRSENGIEGALALAGDLPVLSAVAFEGQLPTAGSAGVSYGCGNGNIGIVSEGLAGAAGYGAGMAGAAGYGFGLAGAAGLAGAGLAGGCGYNVPMAGGCGCGAAYY